jgi:hypothetical protein
MGWYVEYCDRQGKEWKSPLSTTRELAIKDACYHMRQHHAVHRVIGPNREVVDLAEIKRCYQRELAAGRLS